MSKRVKVEGRIITVPDDATPDEIDQIAGGGAGNSLQERIDTLRRGITMSQHAEGRMNQPLSAGENIIEEGKGAGNFLLGMGKQIFTNATNPAKPFIEFLQSKDNFGDLGKLYEGRGNPSIVPAAIRDLADAPDTIGALARVAPGALGEAGAAVVTAKAAPKLQQKATAFAEAEGNANVIYKRFLNPVKDVPETLPGMTPRVFNSLKAKIELRHPDVAQRMASGETTIGDLDVIRMVANKSSQSAFAKAGRLPTETSEAFADVGSAIRDRIYPRIEAFHQMKPGTLNGLKKIQGGLIEMGGPPSTQQIIEHPTLLVDKYLRHPAMRSVYDIRTRMMDTMLPQAQDITLRSQMPSRSSATVRSIQPAVVEMGGEMAPSGLPPRGGVTAIPDVLPEYGPSPTVNPYFLELLRRAQK